MTRVLIAVDGSEESNNAARAAHTLFGDGAEYLAICVSPTPVTFVDPAVGFGAVYPYSMPPDPAVASAAEHEAVEIAHEAAHQAGLDSAEVVGEVGDPAAAILHAADAHHVDVIVVAATHKGWFSRLLTGSVTSTLVRESRVPVLVAH